MAKRWSKLSKLTNSWVCQQSKILMKMNKPLKCSNQKRVNSSRKWWNRSKCRKTINYCRLNRHRLQFHRGLTQWETVSKAVAPNHLAKATNGIVQQKISNSSMSLMTKRLTKRKKSFSTSLKTEKMNKLIDNSKQAVRENVKRRTKIHLKTINNHSNLNKTTKAIREISRICSNLRLHQAYKMIGSTSVRFRRRTT